MIAERAPDDLAKRRGVKLGVNRACEGPQGPVRIPMHASRPNCSTVIAELQAAGATSLRAIAAGLNDRGIPTARGIGP
jgi:hypothetical protein